MSSAYFIHILDGDTVVGAGPIDTATTWESEQRIDEAGPASFTMPLADPLADACLERRIARCWNIQPNGPVEVGSFIISKLEETEDGMLTVSGNDELIALADVTVRTLLATGGNPLGPPNVLPAIMTPAPAGWTTTGTPSSAVYAKFTIETILAALGKVREQTHDHFRRTPGRRTVEWLTGAFPSSGIIADQAGTQCLITNVRRIRDGQQRITRLYFRGSGSGDTAVSADAATWPNHPDPAIWELVKAGANSYLRYKPTDDVYRIDGDKAFPDAGILGSATPDPVSAANALCDRAYDYLRTHIATLAAYELDVVGLTDALLVGQTIRVLFNDWITTGALSRNKLAIDADLIVLGIRTTLTAGGEPAVTLTVASGDRYPIWEDVDAQLAAWRQAQESAGHTQVNISSAPPLANQLLAFNPTSLLYEPTSTGLISGPLTIDEANRRIGINQLVPTKTFDVHLGTDQNIRLRSISGTSDLYAGNDADTNYTTLSLQGSTLLLNPYSGGNVGINTTNPLDMLHVHLAADINLRVRNNSGTDVIAVNDANTLYGLLSVQGSTLVLNYNSGGNVGIGVYAPASLLDVSSPTGAVLTLSRNDTVVTSGESIGKLQFWSADATLTTQRLHATIEAIAAQNITTDAAAGILIFSTTGTSVGGSPVERMRIDSTGDMTFADGKNLLFGTVTGTQIGTTAATKMGFWGTTPIVQPTTAVASATRVGGAGTTVTTLDTFGGYTIAQVVQALRNTGILA